MEMFMDKIIQADKKARHIIDIAQKERVQVIMKFEEEANKDVELRKHAQLKKMASQDEQIKNAEMAEMARADNEYIAAKHNMDRIFNEGIDTWGDEIVSAVLK